MNVKKSIETSTAQRNSAWPTDQLKLSETAQGIRRTIIYYLQRCNIPYLKVPLTDDFHRACLNEAFNLGYPMEGPDSLEPYLVVGVIIGQAAYAHLQDRSAQIYVALYTTILTYLDDNFERHIFHLTQFNERFIRGDDQSDRVLQVLAQTLQELPGRYGPIVSNMIITATMNFITSLMLEHETLNMPLSKDAFGYPTFARTMSGISEAYANFIFPPELSPQTYIQAFPEMMTFINGTNDIMSYYKEELAEETATYVCYMAVCSGVTKFEAFETLAKEVAAAHERVLRILSPHQVAYEAWLGFARGYVSFHASLVRYRLDELDL